MKKNDEILLIAQEECAEVTQAISKIFRFGMDAKHPNEDRDNRQRLTEEVGDLHCMIELMVESGMIDRKELFYASGAKRQKLMKWSNIFKDEPVENTPPPRCATYPRCLIESMEGHLTIVRRPENNE